MARRYVKYTPPYRDQLMYFINRNRDDLNVRPSEVVRRADEWARAPWLLLAVDGDRIDGLVALTHGANLSSSHVGALRLAVDEHAWNQGLGTKLLARAITAAPKLGIRRLEATPYTPLSPWKYHLFIDKGGFEIEGVQRGKVRRNGKLLDALMLVRHFS